MGLKLLLHAGCGSKLNKPPFEFGAYKETRLDCNKMVQPDTVASIVAMPMIDDNSFDAVFCSHTLEHLFTHEVAMALSEFQRVLKPGGKLLVHVPDLQSIGGKLALDEADSVLYQSAIGMITPLDMLYGHRGTVGAGNVFMAHKCGFTQSVLKDALSAAGFTNIKIDREQKFELKAWGFKEATREQEETGRNGQAGEAQPGAAGNGHREVPERALRPAGVSLSAGG